MANSDKDILITPNKNQTALPEISFVGQVNSPIKLSVRDDNSLSFATSTSPTTVFLTIDSSNTATDLFAVADVTGTTSLAIRSDSTLCLSPHAGSVAIGQETGKAKLDLYGPHGVTSFTGASRLGLGLRGSTLGSDFTGIDFYGYYGSQKQAQRLGYDRPFARIAARFEGGPGSFLSFGTSRAYAYGITNRALTINPEGYVGISYDATNSYTTYYDPVSVLSVGTSGTTGPQRQLTIHQNSQPVISFGAYPASWTSALMIQNNNNTDFVWISPIDDGYNARFRTGGCGLDFFISGGNDTGNQMLSLNTEGYGGGNGHAHIFGPLKQQATYANGRHQSFYTYQNTAGGTYYIHMKTNIPYYNSYCMTMIQAWGYAYGNGGRIDCSWNWYTYSTGAGPYQVQYWTDSTQSSSLGMAASTMYQSSDGYCVVVGYTNGHYYIGFTLDALFVNPTPGGFDVRVTAATYSSSQTGVY